MNIFTRSLRALFIVTLLLSSQMVLATISIENIMPASGGSTCDGSFKVVANGSAQPFVVVVLGPTTYYEEGEDITVPDLCPGQYEVEVTDRFGCKKTMTVTVGVACRLTLNAPSIIPSCTTGGGAITVTPQDGTAPFTYQWKDQNGTVVSTAATAPNLLSGTYALKLTDANGCIAMQEYSTTPTGEAALYPYIKKVNVYATINICWQCVTP